MAVTGVAGCRSAGCGYFTISLPGCTGPSLHTAELRERSILWRAVKALRSSGANSQQTFATVLDRVADALYSRSVQMITSPRGDLWGFETLFLTVPFPRRVAGCRRRGRDPVPSETSES